MLGKTHVAGGCLFGVSAFVLADSAGFLTDSVPALLQFALAIPYITSGSLISDCDFKDTNSLPLKSPFVLFINKVVHKICKCSHRSVQTHCLLFAYLGLFLGYFLLNTIGVDTALNGVFRCCYVAFYAGLFSHLFYDRLNSAGIWLYPTRKVSFMVKSPKFSTGTIWEQWVCRVTYVLLFIVILLIILLRGFLS